MKRKLIILLVSAILMAFNVIAQHIPSKEILVFFSEGTSHVKKQINGKSVSVAQIKNEKLKQSLKRIGIEEDSLEAALPDFNRSDTLKMLPDGLIISQPDMTKLFRVKVQNGRSKQELIKQLSSLPEVLYAESNGIVSPNIIPNDSRFGDQWNLRNTTIPGADIHAEAGWNLYSGNVNNIIAIVDGGVEITHVDLDEKILGGDATFGWDGHGTHVAGIAAAESNAIVAQGISGVDWRARIHPQRIDNVDDVGTYRAIVDAVNFSTNVRVLNNSWGLTDEFGIPGRNSTTVKQAFAYAYKSNRTSVVAMGNHQVTYPNLIAYPAGFGNVIAVGATNFNDNIWNGSAQGNHVDVTAPGVSILSTINGNYDFRTGTSMAAPHVSGIASLLKGYNANLANDDIENIIKLSADDRGAVGFDVAFGHGRVNAHRALSYLRTPYRISQWSDALGSSVSSTGKFQMVFLGAPGINDGIYLVKKYEVRKSVTYPNPFIQLLGVWGRGVFTSGLSQANPNFGEGFCEVVPGTQTNNGATLRSFVYEVWTTSGAYLGYYPKNPGSVRFEYSVLGVPAPVLSGPSTICASQTTYTITDIPSGAQIYWSCSSNIKIVQNGYNNFVVTSNGSGEGNVQALVLSGFGQITLNMPVWVGRPGIPSSINGPTELPASGCAFYSTSSSGATEYTWSYSNMNCPNGPVNQQSIYLCLNPSAGSGLIYVFGKNQCGSSTYATLSITRLYAYSFYPNPASESIIITREKVNQNISADSIKTETKFSKNDDETVANEVKIFDFYSGICVLSSTFDQKETVLNIRQLKRGKYIIQISENGEAVKSELIYLE